MLEKEVVYIECKKQNALRSCWRSDSMRSYPQICYCIAKIW